MKKNELKRINNKFTESVGVWLGIYSENELRVEMHEVDRNVIKDNLIEWYDVDRGYIDEYISGNISISYSGDKSKKIQEYILLNKSNIVKGSLMFDPYQPGYKEGEHASIYRFMAFLMLIFFMILATYATIMGLAGIVYIITKQKPWGSFFSPVNFIPGLLGLIILLAIIAILVLLFIVLRLIFRLIINGCRCKIKYYEGSEKKTESIC